MFFPHAAELWEHDRERLLADVSRFSTLAAVVFLPAVPICLSIGGDVLAALFGEQFRSGSTAFALLFGFAGLAMINVNVTNLLLAAGDDRGLVIRSVAAAAACIGLGSALIPLWGATGAAAATIAAELIGLTLAATRANRRLGKIRLPEAPRVAAAAAALVVAIVVLVSLGGAPWLLRAAAAGAAYYGLAVLLGAIRPGRLTMH